MAREVISQPHLLRQLLDIGVRPGGVLLVHCAFSQVKPVEGGPAGLITALQSALGPLGTLVMPSMTDEDDHPFDPARTPCLHLGVVAHTFWQCPQVRRSHNPHAFAARGPQAERITAAHPITLPHGLDSPVGRVYELGGQVLLLGVGHGDNTTIHLAEALAGVRYRRQAYVTISDQGRPTRLAYAEIDHCCQNFVRVDDWLAAEHAQRRGPIGHAEARLMQAQDVVRIVRRQLALNETVFLHPAGVDEECDEARASLDSRRPESS
jgi:aminoglycoside 3-N-acetyltransferase